MLSQLLYNQPELRPSVLKALKVVVESNTTPDEDDSASAIPLTKAKADENRVFLRTQSKSWFAVLFNVFGSVGRDGQGLVGEVIKAWASISNEKVSESFLRGCGSFLKLPTGNEQNMQESSAYAQR